MKMILQLTQNKIQHNIFLGRLSYSPILYDWLYLIFHQHLGILENVEKIVSWIIDTWPSLGKFEQIKVNI